MTESLDAPDERAPAGDATRERPARLSEPSGESVGSVAFGDVAARRAPTRLDWAVASFAIAAIGAHDAAHVLAGRYWDTLWICNVAALVVGPAILLRSPVLSAAAVTWLVPGTVVWLADSIVAGSNILPTSYAVHVGGTAAALYATRVSGISRWGWLGALGMLVGAVSASRLFLPAAANVNAAFAIPRGWSFLGGSRAEFAVTAVTLVLVACGLGRVVGVAVALRPRR